ncbi:BlaI/MecI/CopY family transcriptional regulator [Microbacterium sp. YY-01]|uniref:BlaI/MecI/CopY family transcriptional regulator n=1 Tax=Microbacterium sp. YY-01 TaxID=3421634 RepID=UPI003D18044E
MSGTRTRRPGELEEEIMRLLRQHNHPLSARELQDMFTGRRPAYTTLMTALTRLEHKDEVIRSGSSPRKIRFHPARSGEQHASETMLNALGKAVDRKAALLAFAGNLDEEEVAILRAAFGNIRGEI